MAQLHRCHSAYGLGEVFRDYRPVSKPFAQPMDDKQLMARLAYARATWLFIIAQICWLTAEVVKPLPMCN